MADEATVTVRVSQGELRGSRRRTVWGFPYVSFRGIPYAQPPVGPLRFKPPHPVTAWSGVRDATKHGAIAPQTNMLTGQFEGDEDCLFLNVYTPQMPAAGASKLLPVLVVIHGGGLMGCHGNDDFFGPDYLLPHGMVVVSFNYRLGVLGFLSTGDNVVPGNMGFKDQVMALRWVNQNIRSFGGDPDSVTICGGSAGGWSVHALMLSPLAKGLFRRVIAQSGVSLGDGVVTPLVRDRSFKLGEHLGLKTDDSQQLVDFLRKQPAKVLIESVMNSLSEEDQARGVMFAFVGTVEPADAEGGAFLPAEPADILRSGDFQEASLVTGVAAFEGNIFTVGLVSKTDLASSFGQNHRLLIPTNLRCPDADRDRVAHEIKEFYFGDRDICGDTKLDICRVLGDVMFTYPAVRVANAHSCQAPVYFYLFDRLRESVPTGLLAEVYRFMKEDLKVAGHGADVAFVFYGSLMGDPLAPDSSDGMLNEKLTRFWANFVKTGKPTYTDLDVSWPPFKPEEASYLHITKEGLAVQQRPFAERIAFWDQLYNRYNS